MRISWKPHEDLMSSSWNLDSAHKNLMRFWFSSWEPHDKLNDLMRISRGFKYPHENLMRFWASSWESHENLMRILTRTLMRISRQLKQISWEFSWEAQFSWELVPNFTWKDRSHENLMRISEYLMRFHKISKRAHELLPSVPKSSWRFSWGFSFAHENFCKGRSAQNLRMQ